MAHTTRPITFTHVFGPVNAAPDYSWTRHIFLLSPVLGVLLWTVSQHGWWGRPVYEYFLHMSRSYPSVSEFMRVATHAVAWILYGVYAALLAWALYVKDAAARLFVFRYVFGAILFVVLLTQTIKVCSGMPRPGYDLLPHPFTFAKEYSTFPSGHTVDVLCAAIPLAFWFRNLFISVVLSALMGLVAFSRLWVGAHHPIDIAVAVLVGSIGARYVSCSREYVSASAASFRECLTATKRLYHVSCPRITPSLRRKKES